MILENIRSEGNPPPTPVINDHSLIWAPHGGLRVVVVTLD